MNFKNKLQNQIVKIKKIKLTGKTLIFGVFLVISSFLWLLNSLNKEHTDFISYPLKFKNIPGDYKKNDMPVKIKLLAKGHGYDIMSHKFDHSKPPLIIDLKKIPLKNPEKDHYYVLGENIIPAANQQLKNNLEFIAVRPDTVNIRLTKTNEKYVQVSKKISISPARQYMITKGPYINPDTIMISGPKYIIDKIDSIETKTIKINDLKSDVNRFIELNKPENTKLKPNRVKLSIKVEEFTEISESFPVKVINLPDSLTIDMIPEKVKITYDIPVSKYKLVKKNSFIIQADFKEAKDRKIFPELIHKPDYVKDISIKPKELEYIISSTINKDND